MGIDGNEIADHFARQGSSHPLMGLEPALGITAKVARGVTRGWKSRKHEEYKHSVDSGRIRAFLKELGSNSI
jgi:hypothetical protein